jgi:uncharacterized protein with ParB-like and HNH nuclease domain
VEFNENSLNDVEIAPEVEDTSENEDQGVSNSKYLINSYGADYTVDSLVQRIIRGDIYIPFFERSYIWNINQASKFIESLLLGLPVPGIFLSVDQDRRLVVIDGQQRLKTLERFYKGTFDDRVFTLRNVREDFSGQTYESLMDEDRRQLNDSILHATIIQQISPEDDDSSIYHIFERINTGGVQLQPQEIRAAVYHGEFIELLAQLNEYNPWRNIYGPRNKRGKDQELILRFLALYFIGDNYQKPLNEFLNTFTRLHRNLQNSQSPQLAITFKTTIDIVNRSIGKSAFRSQRVLNAAIFDSIMVGLARRLNSSPIMNLDEVKIVA